MPSVSIVSLNVERSKHLDTVSAFLQDRKPEVVCLQELCERDVAHFESAIGAQCVFAPMGRIPDDPPGTDIVVAGVGIFTKLAVVSHTIEYYAGNERDAREGEIRTVFTNHPLIALDIEKDGTAFRIATTHLTWTPKGAPSDLQRLNARRLFEILHGKDDLVFTGDFNAPRGGEIFSLFARHYRDNIPPQYQTSLDPVLHRAPAEEKSDKMVDGIFSTAAYQVSDVVLTGGVSDHLAVTATISRLH